MSRIPFRVPERLSLDSLQAELTGLLDRWWHRGVSTGPLDGQDWAPAVELREEPERYRVLVELPGVEREAIDLSAQAQSLTIRGERIAPLSTAGADDAPASPSRVVQSERAYGSFKRTITFTSPVAVDRIGATLEDGMLEIEVPKDKGAEPPGIRVEVRTPAFEGTEPPPPSSQP
jgi:HSP20 family protein